MKKNYLNQQLLCLSYIKKKKKSHDKRFRVYYLKAYYIHVVTNFPSTFI